MDLNTYQTEALKTAVYPLERALDYTVLGLCSEVGEYLTNPTKDELGDVWWYWAAVLDALDVRPSELPLWAYPYADAGALAGRMGGLAGHVKKSIRDDEGRMTFERRQAILDVMVGLRVALVYEAEQHGWHTGGVLVANLNKLADRKERGKLQGDGDYR